MGSNARCARSSKRSRPDALAAWLGAPGWTPRQQRRRRRASRSADGVTRLLVNSHQPYTGPVAWYEVRLHSETGWDMAGGVFPGSPVVLHGANRKLGWASTVNTPDLADIYRLEIDPGDPDRYRLDGEWRELEVREAAIRVRLLGRLSWTVRRELLRSAHGPVLRQPHGSYALRFAGMGELRHLDQYLRMNRARSFARVAGRAAHAGDPERQLRVCRRQGEHRLLLQRAFSEARGRPRLAACAAGRPLGADLAGGAPLRARCRRW